MPILLRLDTIEGSRVEETSDGLRIVRGGTVEGLSTTGNGTFDPAVLPGSLSVSGLPVIGELHPTRTSARVVRRLAFPMPSHDTVRLEIHYEDVQLLSALPDNSFRIIRDTSILTNEISEVDYDGDPLVVKYKPVGSTVAEVRRVCKANRYTPLRTCVMSGVIVGKPSINTLKCMGRVNQGSFIELDDGFWLCTSVEVVPPSRGNRYILSASFLTKMHWTWTTICRYVDERGLSPNDITGADYTQLLTRNYNLDQGLLNGLLAAGLYGTGDFNSIFPYTDPPA
jgi:hypothetical protein